MKTLLLAIGLTLSVQESVKPSNTVSILHPVIEVCSKLVKFGNACSLVKDRTFCRIYYFDVYVESRADGLDHESSINLAEFCRQRCLEGYEAWSAKKLQFFQNCIRELGR